MSFDIFFYSYELGEPCPFPLADAESAFQAAIVHREVTEGGLLWQLEYPVENPPDVPPVLEFNGREYPAQVRDCSDVYIGVRESEGGLSTTDGFMVCGPAGHLDFYAALLKLLQTTHSALFWSGNNSLMVGAMESIKHLPEGMIETFGAPILVIEPQQIVDRILAS